MKDSGGRRGEHHHSRSVHFIAADARRADVIVTIAQPSRKSITLRPLKRGRARVSRARYASMSSKEWIAM
jgi:hypothetical protein